MQTLRSWLAPCIEWRIGGLDLLPTWWESWVEEGCRRRGRWSALECCRTLSVAVWLMARGISLFLPCVLCVCVLLWRVRRNGWWNKYHVGYLGSELGLVALTRTMGWTWKLEWTF